MQTRHYIHSSNPSLAKNVFEHSKMQNTLHTIAFCEIKVQSPPSSSLEKHEMRWLDFELPDLTTEQEGRWLFAYMCFH